MARFDPSPAGDAIPHRRTSDSGVRSLFTPKTVIVALLTVAGFGITAGKWLGASEHNDVELGRELEQVQAVEKDIVLKMGTEDQKYVPREVYNNDIAWIKQALQRIEDQTAKK